jgi:hypothetical protein
VHVFTAAQERDFLEACDDWQLPLFLTPMLTSLRPGEACHLLLPTDLDLGTGVVGHTAPKALRHGFATALQDARVDR